MNNLLERPINAITFSPFSPKGSFDNDNCIKSINELIERTGANCITLVPNALQDTPQSEHIDYTSNATISDEELINLIGYIHDKGLSVILKPTVNCKNGSWRAFINFFDIDVVCEPKWSNWFKSYTDFQIHFAKIAQETGCEMFIPGCEMVMSDHRESEWRTLIADLRKVYHGLISYNCDKYQEDHVTWWDCVDVISSSGYYPPERMEQELDRIESVVNRFHKPFFFAECGCMSKENSSKAPNDWTHKGKVDLKEQADWYECLFEAGQKRNWLKGFCIWSWSGNLYELSNASLNGDYEIYGKPAEAVVKKYYIGL